MRFSTILATAAILGGAFSASAGIGLISPDPGLPHSVTTIDKVKTVWDIFDAGTEYNEPYFLDSEGNELWAEATYDMEDYNVIWITPYDPITEAGTYTLVLPANMSEVLDNEEIRITYIVEGGEVVQKNPNPVSVSPESGTVVTQSNETPFSTIRIEFENAVWLDEDGFYLTGPDGPVDFTIGGFYNNENPMFQYIVGNPFVNINFNEEGDLPSGTYTLELYAGAVGTEPGAGGDINMYKSYEWEYVSTRVEGDDTPLVINNILLGKNKVVGRDINNNYVYAIDDSYDQQILFDGCEMPDWKAYESESKPGDVLIFDLNHGEKAGYVYYELYDPSKQEISRQGELTKTDDGLWTLHVPMSISFNADVNYVFTLRTYDKYEAPRVEFGDGAEFTFTGTNEGYKHSPYEFVATSPDYTTYTIRKETDNTFAAIFTGPVKVDPERTSVNYGFGMSVPADNIESRNGEDYDAVWYITIPTSMLDRVSVDVAIYATDKDGRQVFGPNGEGADSYNFITFNLAVTQPRIRISDGNTHKPSLKTFRITGITQQGAEKCLNGSYNSFPELRNKKGETICGIDMEYAEVEVFGDIIKEPFKIIRQTVGQNPEPLELEFSLEKEITEPGQYILYFPDYAINFGTEFDGEQSVEQEFTYWVMPHYDLTYVHDNHSLSLASVKEGDSVTVNVTPAEGWKLSKLMFNNDDVTGDVVNNMYTTPAMLSNGTIAAEYAFDGALAEPTGMNDVVTDFNLRAWSEDGCIYVAGLKAGQDVAIYTTGGARMAHCLLTADDTVRFTVPAGVYIVTVTDGAERAAIKVINK